MADATKKEICILLGSCSIYAMRIASASGRGVRKFDSAAKAIDFCLANKRWQTAYKNMRAMPIGSVTHSNPYDRHLANDEKSLMEELNKMPEVDVAIFSEVKGSTIFCVRKADRFGNESFAILDQWSDGNVDMALRKRIEKLFEEGE